MSVFVCVCVRGIRERDRECDYIYTYIGGRRSCGAESRDREALTTHNINITVLGVRIHFFDSRLTRLALEEHIHTQLPYQRQITHRILVRRDKYIRERRI